MFGVMPYLEIAFGGVSAAGNLVDSLMGLIVIVFLVILCGVFYAAGKSLFYRNRQKVCSVKRAIFVML